MLFKSIETEISFNLLIWGLCSMVGGITFILFENSFMNAIGFQFIIWGLIDSLIAIGPGIYRWIRNHEHIENLKKLKKILIVNAILDIGYVIIGFIIFIGFFEINQYNGHGLGVIIQGAFLAVFDTYYAIKIILKGF